MISNDVKKYIIKEDDSYILKNGYCEAHIPKSYFEGNYASFDNTAIETYGIFYLYIWDNPSGDVEGVNPTHSLLIKVPSTLRLLPSAIEEEREKYVLKFYQADKIIESSLLIQSVTNVHKIMDMIFYKKIPDSIGYSEMIHLWINSCKMNKINLQSPSSLLELIISELARSPKDPTLPFRLYLAKNPDADENARVMYSIKKVSDLNGGFSAFTTGDPGSGLTQTMVTTRYNRNNSRSPMEDIVFDDQSTSKESLDMLLEDEFYNITLENIKHEQMFDITQYMKLHITDENISDDVKTMYSDLLDILNISNENDSVDESESEDNDEIIDISMIEKYIEMFQHAENIPCEICRINSELILEQLLQIHKERLIG